MPEHHRPVTILLADDDEEDRELTRDALQHARLNKTCASWSTGRT